MQASNHLTVAAQQYCSSSNSLHAFSKGASPCCLPNDAQLSHSQDLDIGLPQEEDLGLTEVMSNHKSLQVNLETCFEHNTGRSRGGNGTTAGPNI